MTTYVTTPLHYYKYIMVQNKYLYKYSFMPLTKAIVEKDIVTINRLFGTAYKVAFGHVFKCTSLDMLTTHMLPTTPHCCDFVESEFDNIANALLTAKTEAEWQQIVSDLEFAEELAASIYDVNEFAQTATTKTAIDDNIQINSCDTIETTLSKSKQRRHKSKHAN